MENSICYSNIIPTTNKKFKISIITVCYNASQTIERTILSVINQTYSNIEYIIIDGESTDGTIEIINEYYKKIAIFISEGDDGIYSAMNKGIILSTGDYILFLNANDYFLENDVIQKFVDFLNSSLYLYDIYYGNIEIVVKGKKITKLASDISELSYSMPFCHQSVFCSSNFLKRNKFSLKYKYASDFFLFREAYRNNKKFIHINLNISHYDLTGVSYNKYINYLHESFNIIYESDRNVIFRLIKSLFGLLKKNFRFLLKFYMTGWLSKKSH